MKMQQNISLTNRTRDLLFSDFGVATMGMVVTHALGYSKKGLHYDSRPASDHRTCPPADACGRGTDTSKAFATGGDAAVMLSNHACRRRRSRESEDDCDESEDDCAEEES
jgi:hypothetical protein